MTRCTSHRQVLKTHEPVYQALWADSADFDEVIISPAMIQDHMPDTVLAALEKVSYAVTISRSHQFPYPITLPAVTPDAITQ